MRTPAECRRRRFHIQGKAVLPLFRISAFLLIALSMLLFHIVAIALGSAIYIYLLPGVIALKRNYRSADQIFIASALTGWTVIGWVVTLAFALTLPVSLANPTDEYAATRR